MVRRIRVRTPAKERLQLILPIVFFVIFMLLYVVFHSVAEARRPMR
jgi:Cu/Ag efflux pump CusA